MVRKFELEDLTACAEIMMSVYNNELWQCRWSLEKAKDYLMDYVKCHKFIGYTLWLDDKIVGALFSHEKIWWNSNEIFIDEMFVSPPHQRKGYGTELLNAVENYIEEHKLAGFTLTTNRFTPAPDFYRKNGFTDAEHVLFMYK
ncbi:MAG TPA: GNAT family N-acetyltransferase [Bacteroidales bacterium]|nr:GNAT family N-acetyltransferase [Bacteroidales bacterium]